MGPAELLRLPLDAADNAADAPPAMAGGVDTSIGAAGGEAEHELRFTSNVPATISKTNKLICASYFDDDAEALSRFFGMVLC